MSRYSSEAINAISAMQMNNIVVARLTKKIISKVPKKEGSRNGRPTIPRTRKWVNAIYRELGPTYFRRAFRMTLIDFKHLFGLLRNDIHRVMKDSDRKNCPNGRIPLASRLGIALRYFAGGCPYDLMIVFGVSHTEVYDSATYVIEAINSSENFKLEYPDSHEKQREIAAGFEALSEAGFDCCAGCVDGMLIWTHQPEAEDAEELGVGPTKFYCARKGKFKFNLQALCDHQYRFHDLLILYGGVVFGYCCIRGFIALSRFGETRVHC